MTDSYDIDDLAAEFVLGTLDSNERHSVMARRTREPDLEVAISQWEARLAPLRAEATELIAMLVTMVRKIKDKPK